jgi:selenide,water dikinase
MADIPLLPNVRQLAEQGFITGASGRNWAGYGQDVTLADGISPVQQMLLTDPQTSGGLLVACAADAVEDVLALFRREGFAHAAVIGEMHEGRAHVEVAA